MQVCLDLTGDIIGQRFHVDQLDLFYLLAYNDRVSFADHILSLLLIVELAVVLIRVSMNTAEETATTTIKTYNKNKYLSS